MHWKVKAMIQNALSLLPSGASYASHYWVQRHFGGLRETRPVDRLSAAVEIWKRILNQGMNPSGRVFLEIGTGRVTVVPLGFWLMGAEKTITLDLNPYLKDELIRENLRYIAENPAAIEALFGSLLDRKRFEVLLALCKRDDFSTPSFLETCRIEYLAPGDATHTGLPDGSVDFHTSYMVLEHIPPEVLERILLEGNRIMRNGGLFIHRVDYSDHFAHSDKNISYVNFLQYSDGAWNLLGGNRYMYMNRLRHDDYLNMFRSASHRLVEVQPTTDQRSQALLRAGSFRVDERFSKKSQEILSISSSWFVSSKAVE